jgi:site-specific recombinase XerD
MLDTFFTQIKVRSRMESGPIGPYLSEIAAMLHRDGYARSTIRRHLRAADRFGAWILKEGMSIVDISASIVDRYLEGLGRQFFPSRLGGTLPDKASGLRQMVEMLSQQGVLRPDANEQPPIGIARCVADFDHHLDQVRGNAPRTRKIYLWYARRFLLERFGAEEPDWSTLEAEQITEFVRREAAKKHPSSCGQAVTGIRALLRFLVTKGVVRKGLERAVPSVRTWRHCSLPRHISPDEVRRVIEVCDPATPLGLRERAVIMLLAHMGLRAGEVIHLKVNDIDWAEGRLIIRAGKNHRERSLPLSQVVGEALAAYLQQARPRRSPYREIFLRWYPPFRPLRSSCTISALVGKVLKRARVEVNRPGAHVFRHTLATEMARQGAAFKEIADILGHRSLVSTGVYAKLDLGSLSKVAMPWPGGAR